MANLTVRLVIYCKTEGNVWRRFKTVPGQNGRLRPGFALVDGKPTKFKSFVYQLRTYDGKKTVYQTIGTDAVEASAKQMTDEKHRKARREARLAGVAVVEDASRQPLATLVTRYLDRLTKRRKIVAAQVYGHSLKLFQHAVPDVAYVDQVNENTLLEFHAYLRSRGSSERTIANRHGHVKSFLLWCGVSRDDVKKRLGDSPKYDKKVVVAYTRDELSTLFAAAEGERYFWTVLRLLQMAGLREAEATHLAWTDIDFKRGHIKVTAKPDLGFYLKDREERVIPLPDELATILHERRKVVPRSRLVVGTNDDQPHTKWLRLLKRTARDCGLNCGHCSPCREYARTGRRGEDSGCQHWTLHSFRRTYATTLHAAGFTVKQIMDLLGHSDMETTMRYLACEALETNRESMRKVSW